MHFVRFARVISVSATVACMIANLTSVLTNTRDMSRLKDQIHPSYFVTKKTDFDVINAECLIM